MKKTSRILLATLLVLLVSVASFSARPGPSGCAVSLEPESSSAKEAYDLRALRVLARTVLYIQGNYLDQDKVKPRKMLIAALDKVEWKLPEVVVTPAPGETEEAPAALKVSVGKASNVFDIGKLDSLWAMREKLKEIIGYIQDHLHDPDVKLPEVEYAAINGILSTLDPHSVLLDPDTYREMKVSTHGEFGGLGIVISIRDHDLTIISPLEDTPAWRAGLKAQDKIVQIEDESTINMRLDEAVKRLRGKVGTQVTISVHRKGWAQPRSFTITRERITIKSVTSKLLDGGVGYVKLKSFQGHSQEQVREHLDRMRSENKGELTGVVLDLRGNPGGLLEQAIKISDLFLDSGTVVLTVGKGNTIKEEHKASWSGTEKRYPMVVLVGPGSASASEIVAGALQNNDRALVVGNKTFGKGSVQVLYDMEDGAALKLTIAQYLTPGEVSIQGVGITPDVGLTPVTIQKDDITFYDEERFGEVDLDAHLTNDAALDKAGPEVVVRYYEEPPPELPEGEEPPVPDEDEVKEDFALRFASGLLRRVKSYRRREMLEEAHGFIESQHEAEMEHISRELAGIGVDWKDGPNTPGNQPQVTLTSGNEGNRIKAGETLMLKARVQNVGTTPLYRVRGITESDNVDFQGREFVFGLLGPEQEREWDVPVEIGQQRDRRTDVVTLHLYSGDEPAPLGTARLLVETQELPRPHFVHSWQVIDDKGGNGDGLIQRGETVELLVTVRNTGPGDGTDVLTSLTNLSGEGVFLEDGRHKLESLPAGERAQVRFRFQVKPKVNEDHLELRVDIVDTKLREGVDHELKIPVQPKGVRVDELKGSFTVAKQGADLVGGASKESPHVGRVSGGLVLPAVGRIGEWVKVSLAEDRPAWLVASEGKLKRGRLPKGELPEGALSFVDTNVPPSVTFEPAVLAQKVTTKDRIRVSGYVSDDELVRDVYIFSQYRAGKLTKSRKVTFLVNDDQQGSPTRLPFSAEIPLEEGVNTLAVVARDGTDHTSLERIRVLRLPAAYTQAHP